MSSRTLLQGKVAQIVNERELVINIGSNDGVRQGLRFNVLAATPLEIKDPDTGESLGQIDRPKVKVQASQVSERFTICRTYEKTTTVGGRTSGALRLDDFYPRSISPDVREVYKTLRYKDGENLPPLPLSESYIKIGDRVVQIEEND